MPSAEAPPPGGGRHLRPDPRGFWRTDRRAAVSFPEGGHQECLQLEEASFWFRHRNDVIVDAVRRFPPRGAVFDVGGGNGYVSLGIQSAGFPVVLVEPGEAGAENAVRRGLAHVVCSTVEDAGFAPASLGGVGLFDVIEHVRDDAGFLSSLHALLQPGGRIYLTVPAYRLLWSVEDDAAGHERRYTRAGLRRALEQAGFELELLTGFFWFLPLPILLLRAVPYRLGFRRRHAEALNREEHAVRTGVGGRLLARALSWERGRLGRGRALPWGASWLAVARRAP